ncbi:hypothetical protein [Kitasatospora sp. NPDC087314]|uniref:hypothetical protein n=1 Tax=Kitasatospora sp. NPDC087314 TaxID=3364068 RepID=UPI00382194F7
MDNAEQGREASRRPSTLKRWVGADASTKAGLERVLRLARSLVLDTLLLVVGVLTTGTALIELLCHTVAGATGWVIRAGIGAGGVAGLAGAARLHRELRRTRSRRGRRQQTP